MKRHRDAVSRVPVRRTTFVTTAEQFEDLTTYLLRDATRLVAIDSEFNNDNSLETFQLCMEPGVRYVVRGKFFPQFYTRVMCHPNTAGVTYQRFVYQHFKADYRVFVKAAARVAAKALGLPIKRVVKTVKDVVMQTFYLDTLVMDFVHDENDRIHGLKYQSRKWLGWHRKEYTDLFFYIPEGKKQKIIMQPRQMMRGELPDEALQVRSAKEWCDLFIEYGADDADSTLQLEHVHERYMRKIDYFKTFTDIDGDMEWTRTLIKMEERCVFVDVPYFERIAKLVRAQQLRILRRLRDDSGEPKFNPNSNPQKQRLFFKKLKWPKFDDLRTATDAPSLDAEAMKRYVDDYGYGLARLMQAWNREEAMRRSVAAILAGVEPVKYTDSAGNKHVLPGLYTDFVQCAADTGRISSRKRKKKVIFYKKDRKGNLISQVKEVDTGLQLQNVPVRKEKDLYGIRGGFIAPPGEDLIVADYGGAELLMALHWASMFVKDSPMMRAMLKYKTPSAIHGLTAIASGRLTEKDPLAVKAKFPDAYNTGKQNNFSLLYGAMAKRLCQIRAATAKPGEWDWRDKRWLAKAERDIREWNLTWPEMGVFQREMVNWGYEQGWVPVIDGRRVHVAEGLASDDYGIKSYWERKCKNTPCQGSIAVISKIAGNLIERDEELKDLKCKQLLWVHDEDVLRAPEATSERAAARVKELMIEAGRHPRILRKFPLKFDMYVEVKRAKNWLAAK